MTTRAGWRLHRAERADVLAHALGELLATPLADPFAAEVVAVPARGVERWLAHRLSHRLGTTGSGEPPSADGGGICAGVSFAAPAALIGQTVADLSGYDPDEDPWRPERAVWPLLEVLDACAGEPWCAPLARHLADPGRRYGIARHLADLFAGYATDRPELLTAWSRGEQAPDGPAADLAWQPQLWRRLAAHIGGQHPAQRLATACARLRGEPDAVALPARLSLFGPTRLPAAHLAVLDALAAHREVHLWLPHPSPVLWAAVAAHTPRAVVPRRSDPTAAAAAHPLLGSLGRDDRELQLRLAIAAPGAVDVHHIGGTGQPRTLLERLQADLRDDRPPDGSFVLAPGDSSVAVHSCHGGDRQAEVLREVVLGLLAADPTLQPRDVLVMCPDIETFAPLVSACFGATPQDPAAAHPGRRIPVRLADRALRQVNPVLDVVARLLELVDARATASQLLDLLATAPVRRRFDLDDADLERIRELVTRAGVRWGLDGAHRAPFQLSGFVQNTWAAGLDRLLLGVAMPGDRLHWLGTALPLDQVESGDIVLVGRLTEFVERVGAVVARLAGPQPLDRWGAALHDGLDTLTLAEGTEEWQGAQARAELAAAVRAAGPHAATVDLDVADVRGLLAERLRGRPTRANFRTGAMTVATLVPMRSVPHRVICLLGLDDGVFPRAGMPDGDDLTARDPHVGERDPRSEDRRLLLDAIRAATEHLVVVHSGADERTGARRPPAVPLGELLDTIAATAGPDALEQVVVRHPLQPFDRRNFVPGALGGTTPFSFDRTELAGALAAQQERTPPPPPLRGPLPPVAPAGEADVVALADLVAFVEHPVQEFLRQRVGLSLFTADDQETDALPLELDGLRLWQVGDRLLRDRLAGTPLDRCRQAEWRRGELPPGPLGESALARVLDDVEPIVAAALPFHAAEGSLAGPSINAVADDRDIDVDLADGRLVGTVGGLHGDVLLSVEYSRLQGKQRLRAWVRLLALTVATQEPWRAVTIGRRRFHGLEQVTLGPVDPGNAREVLGDLVALHREGLREPLPLPPRAGYEYALRRGDGLDAAAALDEALGAWTSGREHREPAHLRAFGPDAGGAVLTAPGPATGGEPTRFGTLVRRVWSPLLRHQEVTRL